MDDETLTPHLIVYEPEAPPSSGLLDADGNPLVRERAPIGFDLSAARRVATFPT